MDPEEQPSTSSGASTSAGFPSRVFVNSDARSKPKKIPDKWVRLGGAVDWERKVGRSGAAIVTRISAPDGDRNVYWVKPRTEKVNHVDYAVPRNLVNHVTRDEIDRGMCDGREVLGLADRLWNDRMQAFDIDHKMIKKFLPYLGEILHGGTVQFAKQDFFHLKCMSEVFKYASGQRDRRASVVDGLIAVLGTSSLELDQTAQFANFLLKFGFSLDLYSAVAVPTGHNVQTFRHLARSTAEPGFTDGITESWFEYSGILAGFISALLYQGEETKAIRLLIDSGVPGTALKIRKKIDEKDGFWLMKLQPTLEWVEQKVRHEIRATNNRLWYMQKVGQIDPKSGKLIEPYHIPCPVGCWAFGYKQRLPPVPHMKFHMEMDHKSIDRIPCDKCQLSLPSETDELGPLWREKSYMHHQIYCPKANPIYATCYVAKKSLRSVEDGPNYMGANLGYPRIAGTGEFSDLNVDYLVVGSEPSTVIIGCSLAVRKHTNSEIDHYANVVANVWDPYPDYRPCSKKFMEDVDPEYGIPYWFEVPEPPRCLEP